MRRRCRCWHRPSGTGIWLKEARREGSTGPSAGLLQAGGRRRAALISDKAPRKPHKGSTVHAPCRLARRSLSSPATTFTAAQKALAVAVEAQLCRGLGQLSKPSRTKTCRCSLGHYQHQRQMPNRSSHFLNPTRFADSYLALPISAVLLLTETITINYCVCITINSSRWFTESWRGAAPGGLTGSVGIN